MVSVDRRGRVAILTVSNPPVNAVSAEIAKDLDLTLTNLIGDPDVSAFVIQGAGSNFIAGADIKMLSMVAASEIPLPDLNTFLFRMEESPKPVVSAIAGAALGGGLETAMAGHYRVALSNANLGQPEVNLGLIPGMGATQRLPRLVGTARALEMCVTGDPISAAVALEAGLVDKVVDKDLLEEAIALAERMIGKPLPTSASACSPDPGAVGHWRDKARKIRRCEEAPLAVIDAIESAAATTFSDGFAHEQRLFNERLRSAQAAAMMHAFFAERTASKIPGLRAEVDRGRIARAAILGAGFMGTGIAMAFANAGIPVHLSDASGKALERAQITIAQRSKNASLIEIRPDLEGFERAEIIVEAVIEDLSIKEDAFTKLARVAGDGCILATNTSTLDIDEIASCIAHKEHFAGLHFFSPAHIMRLLEVVRGTHTSDEVISSLMALGKRLGKIPVLSRNEFGFIGNRLVLPYLREAHQLVEEGVAVEQINGALYNFGMRMGPLAMEDLVGLDVTYFMRQEAQRRGRLDGAQPRIPDLLYRSGRYGQKTGAGWSLYDDKRRPSPNPEIHDLFGGSLKRIQDEEIVSRCLGALIEEGQKVVAEGVALRPSDVDVVYVHGYGFPAWRGGPLYWAAHPGS